MNQRLPQPSQEERIKLLDNTLRFIVNEIAGRIEKLNESSSDERRENLDKDLEAYDFTRILAHKYNHDTKKYDDKLKEIQGRLIT